jgi:hypothetical protein
MDEEEFKESASVQLPGRPLAPNNGQLSNLVRTSNGYGTPNLAAKLNGITQELFHRQVVLVHI